MWDVDCISLAAAILKPHAGLFLLLVTQDAHTCRIKYYNDVLFHNVQKGFIVQTGDPTGTGNGGSSVYGCAL